MTQCFSPLDIAAMKALAFLLAVCVTVWLFELWRDRKQAKRRSIPTLQAPEAGRGSPNDPATNYDNYARQLRQDGLL